MKPGHPVKGYRELFFGQPLMFEGPGSSVKLNLKLKTSTPDLLEGHSAHRVGLHG